eukprot:jgi/Picsp_1/2418/NSC_05879-R1_hypothetical protein CHLNCDRAFT_143565 [Chlorella variabilis]
MEGALFIESDKKNYIYSHVSNILVMRIWSYKRRRFDSPGAHCVTIRSLEASEVRGPSVWPDFSEQNVVNEQKSDKRHKMDKAHDETGPSKRISRQSQQHDLFHLAARLLHGKSVAWERHCDGTSSEIQRGVGRLEEEACCCNEIKRNKYTAFFQHFTKFPWCFPDEQVEQKYLKERYDDRILYSDVLVACVWGSLWLAIIARLRSSLSRLAIFRSFVHCFITIGPLYWTKLMNKLSYKRYRGIIIAASIVSYTLHPGGGLYRDAVTDNVTEHTGLGAIKLFVKALISSRMLFWQILLLGYSTNPRWTIPLNMVCLMTMSRMKPPDAFCKSLYDAGNGPLFRMIESHLPIISIIPMWSSDITNADELCRPLMNWFMISIGFMFVTCIQLALDYCSRAAFVDSHKGDWSDMEPSPQTLENK